MLRNLLASAIILAASASSFAGIAEDLTVKGATSTDVVNTALSACADADCKAAVLVEAIAAGIDATSVMNIAYAANIAPTTIQSAMLTAKVDPTLIVQTLADNGADVTTLLEAPAGGNTVIDTDNTNDLPPATEVPGISPGA